jgi:hypothetical protein
MGLLHSSYAVWVIKAAEVVLRVPLLAHIALHASVLVTL